MGCYLETKQRHGKAAELVALGALIVPEPEALHLPPGQLLICVVENPLFDAAAWVYDEFELRRFKYDTSGRARTWLLLPEIAVRDLAPTYPIYKEGRR